MAPRPNKQSGFTILELIVVLVLASLLVTVVFGAFNVILRTQASVGRASSDLIGMISERERVINVLRGFFPSYSDEEFQIEGSAVRLQGKTTAPLFGWQGLPTPVYLELFFDPSANQTLLQYEEPPYPSITLLRLAGDEAEFAYYNESLQQTRQWPAALPSQRSEMGQPTLIQLTWGVRPEDVIVVYTASIADLPLRPSDLPGATR